MMKRLAILLAVLLPLSVSAAPGGPSSVLVIDTLAHMTGLSATVLATNPDIQLLGYTAAGDGGGGEFHYFSASAASTNICTTFAPAAGSGRIIRVIPGRVVTPYQCGAKGDGTTDDTTAFQAAMTLAGSVASTTSPGSYTNLTGNGGTFLINSAISVPVNVSFLEVSRMTIRAGASFPAGHYLIEQGLPVASGSTPISGSCTIYGGFLCNTDLWFDHIFFDVQHKGGCITLGYFRRVRYENNVCEHYGDTRMGAALFGLWDRYGAGGSNELKMDINFFGEYEYNESNPSWNCFSTHANCVGTAVEIESNDQVITNTDVGISNYGFVVGLTSFASQNDRFSMNHDYSVRGTHLVNTAGIVMDQFYFGAGDAGSLNVLQIDNPYNTVITNSLCYVSATASATACIVLKPTTASISINGLIISQDTFIQAGGSAVDAVSVDSSGGSINGNGITSSFIKDNSFSGVNPKYTEYTMSATEASGFHTFDFSSLFPFGNIQRAEGNYFVSAANNTVVISTNINSGSQVTVGCQVVTPQTSPNPVLSAGNCSGKYTAFATVNTN